MARFNMTKYLERGAMFMALSLFAFFSISYLADYHWIPERYIHTLPQYGVFASVFCLYFAFQKYWKWTGLMIIVVLGSAYGTISSVDYAPKHNVEISIKIVIYNKLFYLHEHDDLIKWIQEESPDILVLQEANTNTLKAIEHTNLYPHVIHKLTPDPFGMIMLSKFPIEQSNITDLNAGPQNNFFIHAIVNYQNTKFSVFTAHTVPPVSHIYFAQRNKEFEILSDAISRDTIENTVFLGDFNVTPYSPFFKGLLSKTSLKNEYTTLMPPQTWSSFKNYIFQIPIDHILHKGDLLLIEKRRGPSMGSDHYPLIATFAIQ